MKPRIFLDTNIMLDLIQKRPGYEACARVLQRQEDGEAETDFFRRAYRFDG